MRKVAVAGKGGSGKTTISGTLTRIAGRRFGRILAVDGDPNPNLAAVLGIERSTPWPLLPNNLLVHEDVDGRHVVRFSRPVAEVIDEYSVTGPDGVRMLALGEVEAAGKG